MCNGNGIGNVSLPYLDPCRAGHTDHARAAPRHTGQEQGQQAVRLPRTQETETI
jgi:hypothetical protein